MFEKAKHKVEEKIHDAQDTVRGHAEAFNKRHDERNKKKYSVGKHLGHGAFNAAMASMVIGAMPGERGGSVAQNLIDDANNQWNRFVERQAQDKITAYEEEMRLERTRSIEELAPDFDRQIKEKIAERRADLMQVWLNGFSPDAKLDGVSKYEYLKTNFLSEESTIPEAAASPLRSLITRLVATESRFDTHAVSHTNAFSAVQAIPSTFRDWHMLGKKKEISPEKYDTYREDFISDFGKQVEFLNWYFPYMYDRFLADPGCKKELDEVKALYFPDDEDAFNRYFMAPLLLNSYNAGYGTMKELIEGARGNVRSFRETHPHSIPNHKYLAIFLMTEDTDFRNPETATKEGRYFDTEKHEYLREILAFDFLIAEMIKNGRPDFKITSTS